MSLYILVLTNDWCDIPSPYFPVSLYPYWCACQRPLFAGGQIDKALAFLNDNSTDHNIDSSRGNNLENRVGNSSGNSSSNSSVVNSDNNSSSRLAEKRGGRFRLFAGCCLWDQGELQRDVDAGYWIPVLR